MNEDDIKKLRRLIREELDKSEQRIATKEDLSVLEQRIGSSINQLSADIGQFIEDRIVPLIDEKADRKGFNKVVGRIDRIESLPTIAHELKTKK